jgi:hypothetical protein
VCLCVCVVVVNRFRTGKPGIIISFKYGLDLYIYIEREIIVKSIGPTIYGDPSSCQTNPNRNIKHRGAGSPQGCHKIHNTVPAERNILVHCKQSHFF